MFFFISIFFTSIIINIKNRNLKSMLISLIFITIYGLASAGTFFEISLLRKMGIQLTNFNYYVGVGILVFIQILMIILIYFFADPFAREKKIEKMKETGQYDKMLKVKQEKQQKRLKEKEEKFKKRLEIKQDKKQKRKDKIQEKKQMKDKLKSHSNNQK